MRNVVVWAAHLLLIGLFACGGEGREIKTTTGAAEDICACIPTEPTSSDYRYAAKHVAIPATTPQNVTVAEILKWDLPAEPAADAPRAGRETQVFRVPRAFLQLAWINPVDCDIHLEISETPDKNAPRLITETETGEAYCSARRQIEAALAQRGFTLNKNSGELSTALPVEVIGLAFQDYNHKRGSNKVATSWEIHPALLTVLPQ